MPTAIQTNTESNSNSNDNISNTMRSKATGLYAYIHRSIDWAMPPSSRQRAYDHISAFASARPILFSFIVAQTLLSFLPILLFATFSVCTVLFGLGAAIIFALFWTGLALLVLVPTLLVTSSIAVLVWAWSVGSFLVARWLYQRAPFGVSGEVQVDAGRKQVSVVKDQKGFDGSVKDVKAEQ